MKKKNMFFLGENKNDIELENVYKEREVVKEWKETGCEGENLKSMDMGLYN